MQTYSVGADTRIVGGCLAGHIPWYVLILHDALKYIGPPPKCGGVLINKFWIISAAHCFCAHPKDKDVDLPCKRIEGRPRKIVPNYTISEIKVCVYLLSKCVKNV